MRLSADKYLLKIGQHKNLFTRSELIDILTGYDAQPDITLQQFKTFREALEWKYGTIMEASRRLGVHRNNLNFYMKRDNAKHIKLPVLRRMQLDGINAVQLFNLNSEDEE